jgi:hypothetical protein
MNGMKKAFRNTVTRCFILREAASKRSEIKYYRCSTAVSPLSETSTICEKSVKIFHPPLHLLWRNRKLVCMLCAVIKHASYHASQHF